MTLSNLVYFYRRRLRARRVQEAFALVGLAIGVALLFSVQVASTSVSASVEQLTQGLFGRAQWQVVARDSHGFDERIADEIRHAPDVQLAVPVLELPVNVRGDAGATSVTLVAADARIQELGGTRPKAYASVLAKARVLALAESVADSIGAGFGDQVQLDVRGRGVDLRTLVLSEKEFGTLAQTSVAVAPLAYGQELAGLEGRVSRVYVRARPGREAAVGAQLRRIAGDRLDVRGVDADARIFEQAALPSDQSTGLFAAISAFVGFLFAYNALLLVAGQRRELIAALRLWGFSKRSVVMVLLFDALVLGLLASALGLALGEVLSRTLFPPAPGYLALAFPVGVGRVVSWQAILLAVGCGVVAAVAATLVPLVQQLRRGGLDSADDEVSHADGGARLLGSRWLWCAGLVCLALATVVLFVAPGAAIVGMLALLASMLLCLPAVLARVLAVTSKLRRRVNSSVPMLADGALRSNRSRSVAVSAMAAIALMGSISIEGSHRDLQRGLDVDVHELSSVSDVWVSAAGDANDLATTPFRVDVAESLRGLPAVAAVEVQRGSFLDIGDRRVWVLAPPRAAAQPVPASQILEGDRGQALARLRGHGWAAVSEALADEQDLHVGQAFTLRSPRPSRFRLAAIISNLGWTPGTIVVNAEDYARAWGSTDASALRVDLSPSASPAEGRRAVVRALGPDSGLRVETAAGREKRQRHTARQGLARLTQIAGLVLGAAALAMAAAMGAMVWQRRQALAGVKLVGVRWQRVWKALLLESGVLLGTGCTMGALYGLYGAQLLNRTLTTVTGFPVESSIAVRVAVASYAILAIIAFAIAAIASYFAAHVETRTALQD